jgi:hypothetical protein
MISDVSIWRIPGILLIFSKVAITFLPRAKTSLEEGQLLGISSIPYSCISLANLHKKKTTAHPTRWSIEGGGLRREAKSWWFTI